MTIKSGMHKRGVLVTSDVCNPMTGSMAMHQQGETQFQQFVMDTFDVLYKIELKQLLVKSSINIFVHFDILLIVNRQDKQVYYFINEVKRTQTITLWSNRLSAKSVTPAMGILGYTLAETLYKWLTVITNAFTL
jgi:hypothetical protein